MKTTLRLIAGGLLAITLFTGILGNQVAAANPSDETNFIIEYKTTVLPVVENRITVPNFLASPDAIDVLLFETGVDNQIALLDQNDNLLWTFAQVINWTYTDTGLIYSIDAYYSTGNVYATGWSYIGIQDSSTTYGSSSFTYYSKGRFYSSSNQTLFPYFNTTVYGDGTYHINSHGIA
jgi:hypothetical protein